MPNKSKEKGNRFERQLVMLFESFKFKAVRAWGSNGKSLGLPEEVDILVEGETKVQAKCRKQIPKFLGMTDNVDMVAFKEDRGETYLMIRAVDYLKEKKELHDMIWELREKNT